MPVFLMPVAWGASVATLAIFYPEVWVMLWSITYRLAVSAFKMLVAAFQIAFGCIVMAVVVAGVGLFGCAIGVSSAWFYLEDLVDRVLAHFSRARAARRARHEIDDFLDSKFT